MPRRRNHIRPRRMLCRISSNLQQDEPRRSPRRFFFARFIDADRRRDKLSH